MASYGGSDPDEAVHRIVCGKTKNDDFLKIIRSRTNMNEYERLRTNIFDQHITAIEIMTNFTESENVELKETWGPRALRTVSAFLNEYGGKIYVGVKDDGTVVGVEDADNMCTSITSSISDNVRPDPIGNVSLTIISVEGKDVVEVRVDRGSNRPYYLKEKDLREGGVFIRRGTSSVVAPEDLVMKMVRERPSSSYETLPSMRQDLTFEATGRFFEGHGVEFGRKQMESLGMVSEGAYTNLAFMLSDQFDQGIKMAVFEDEYKGSFLDRSEASGSVLSQFEEAYGFVDRHNSKHSRIVGPRRIDSRDYPEEAVREAVINAIAHRDYGIKGDVSVSVLRDRLVVLSVGGLNTGLGVDDIMAGVSSRRNPGLAAILYRLELMETYGTGIPRIMGLYRNQPVKPRIETTTNSFKIVLPRTLPESLSDDELKIMGLFETMDAIRRRDVESALKVSKTKASGILSALEEAGLIERGGSGRDMHYRKQFES